MQRIDEIRQVLAKRTRGDWYAVTRQGSWDWLVAVANSPFEICQMFHDGTDLNETGEANSRLVAMAPDLATEVLRLTAESEEQEALIGEERIFAKCAIDAKSAEVARLREALTEAEKMLRLVEHPSRVDPLHGDEVAALGERIGFGVLMSSASASWRASIASKGYPSGGEFVSGPCQSTVTSTLRIARAALGDPS